MERILWLKMAYGQEEYQRIDHDDQFEEPWKGTGPAPTRPNYQRGGARGNESWNADPDLEDSDYGYSVSRRDGARPRNSYAQGPVNPRRNYDGYSNPGYPQSNGYGPRYDGGGLNSVRYRQEQGGVKKKINPLAPKKLRNMPAYPEDADESGRIPKTRMLGVLEMHPNGYGFIRDPRQNYDRQFTDPFVSSGAISKLQLREGVEIDAIIRPRRSANGPGPRVLQINKVGGGEPSAYRDRRDFEDLVPVPPNQWLRLEDPDDEKCPLSMRVIDIMAPLGKGQRALIVAPPRSGKTVLLQQIATSLAKKKPDADGRKIKVIVLLIDERPEEVTDFIRTVPSDVEVLASSLDKELESHIRLAQFVTKRCKSLVEMGEDVVLLLDSITRLARAFNKWVGNSGRTMTGGVDVNAMNIPKKIFSSARSIDGNKGSLTIIGTALIDTGSRMDELIFQEFKGTGNMELVLDRNLAERRIWPAIDVSKSGTRREELLLGNVKLSDDPRSKVDLLRDITRLRRALATRDHVEAMAQLVQTLEKYRNNEEFFEKCFH